MVNNGKDTNPSSSGINSDRGRVEQKRNQWGIPELSSKEIRSSFINFFEERQHKFIRSAPVAPQDDPTLLFINAGMNQFKQRFLGESTDGVTRAVNSQKCLRVSGKHNDLDEVGRDTYHQTLFEMLGNWSFGDYYKKEAILWAWELLTEVWQLPKDRLFITVYEDDDEAEELWKAHTDLDPWRIQRFDSKDNFWEMGDIGPCGPACEIHFDLGDPETQRETFSDKTLGVNGENARYIEIWNLVFMEYERLGNGDLKPLKAKNIDTGMGFERVCSIIQGSGSNYETDIFRPLIDEIAKLAKVPYESGEAGTPHRVIADHLRALAFAVADGVTPGNEGRGYVLRRILRRASRFSQLLGQEEPFIYQFVPTLIEVMGEAYPELSARRTYITQVIKDEEQRFMKTLKEGLQRFEKLTDEIASKPAKPGVDGGSPTIPGELVFTLYDTYGFPADLTEMLAAEKGLKVDMAGFDEAMEEQRQRARGAAKFDANLAAEQNWIVVSPESDSKFIGYETLEIPVRITRYSEHGDDILVCLKETPFYAEAGGQVGDVGTIANEHLTLQVVDTFTVLDMHVHRCRLSSGLLDSDNFEGLKAQVDGEARRATVRNHSATHLLHAALRQVLGDHVQQQGSRVAPEGLRFDFTHPKAISKDEQRQIEQLVNREILTNHPVATETLPIDDAKKAGATALFGEKYGDVVRTIKMGGFSFELCGGTHANLTGDIGLFKITSESSISAGIRRLEATTGLGVLGLIQSQEIVLDEVVKTLKAQPEDLALKVQQLAERAKSLEKRLLSVQLAKIDGAVATMLERDSQEIEGRRCLIQKLDATDFPKATLQPLLESLAGRLESGVAILTQVEDGTLSILAASGSNAKKQLKAGDLVKLLAEVAGGQGGGRPDRAQAGSKHPEKEPVVLDQARTILKERLAALKD